MAGSSKKVIYAALVGNSLIAVTKFVAASITGSAAMLAEGIHSLVDTGNQVLLLFGLKRAARPANERFPFGYGKEVYFWSFVVAIMIFAVGAGVALYEGVHSLMHPEPSGDPTINYIVLILAMIFESFALYFAVVEFRKSKGDMGYFEAVQRGKDPTMFVVLFEDSAAMAGLMVAFVGIWLAQVTGNPLWDGVATVMIGLILGGTGIWLAIETKGLLIGEAASRDVVANVKRLAGEDQHINHVNEVLSMHVGPEFVLLNLSVTFVPNLTAGEIENAISLLDQRIKAAHPLIKKVFVEAESGFCQLPQKPY